MRGRIVTACALILLGLAGRAGADGLPITLSGGAWTMKSPEKVSVWANSPEANLGIDNRGRNGFINVAVTWQNLLAGAFLSTPEGVVLGSSRDGGDLVSNLTVSPGDRQQWALHPNINGSAYRFAVIGDTRNALKGQGVFGALGRDMAAKQVQFAIHLGDAVAHGNARQMAVFREQLANMKFPTYVLPGHDDLSGGGRKAWQGLFGSVPATFRIAKDRFILLDNAFGTLDERQHRWLEETLQQAANEQARHIFVFLHQPLVDLRPGLNQGMHRVAEVRGLLRLFQRHQVHSVFAGHIHMYAQERRFHVNYITTGGGGDKLAARGMPGSFHHYMKVEVDGDAVNIAPIPLLGSGN